MKSNWSPLRKPVMAAVGKTIMAWIFSLAAECGPDESKALAFASHFANFIAVTDMVEEHWCSCHVFQDSDGGWWVAVCPDGVSASGIGSEQDRIQMTAIAFRLYEKLREAPSFRFAIAGVEAEQFRTFQEIDDDFIRLDFNGLVIDDSIWDTLGQPEIFVTFSPSHRWRPFREAK